MSILAARQSTQRQYQAWERSQNNIVNRRHLKIHTVTLTIWSNKYFQRISDSKTWTLCILNHKYV